MCRQRTLLHRQTKIVEHIDGIHIVLDVIFKLALLLIALRISHIASCKRYCQGQHHIQRHTLHLALELAVDAHTLYPLPCCYCEQGQIEYEHACNGWHQIVEQFHSLAGVGGDEIEEHVNGYHAVAVQIDEHHLERSEENQQEKYPHHAPYITRNGHNQGV